MTGRRGRSAQRSPGTGQGARPGRSIRASLVALALVPGLALIVLWASGSAVLLNQWRQANRDEAASKTAFALMPVMNGLQKERLQTVTWLASPGSRTALDAQRRETDAALAGFRRTDAVSGKDGTAGYLARLRTVRTELAGLTTERAAVDTHKESRRQAYTDYTATVTSVLNLFGALSAQNGDTATDAGHTLSFFRATEKLSQESALLAQAAASGRLSTAERADLASAAAVHTALLTDEVTPYLPADERTALARITSGRDWTDLTALEAAIPAAPEGNGDTIAVHRFPDTKAAAPARVTASMGSVLNQYLAVIGKEGTDRTSALFTRVMLGSALALIAVLAVAAMSYRITRSLIGRMSSLRRETLELAQDRLPEMVALLRAQGSRAEVDGLPELDYGSDELGKVAEAFNTAQRTAVTVALEQAQLREGARLVFVNMSRRTQVLVHRQLTLIDGMERREQDPDLLADLYTVDHLATRMRRNAESLTVLSGSTPRRRWNQAVPLSDVLRSSVSEVEGYARVVVDPMPSVAVIGPAVGDTIHLMAELIENGVTFSPPHTEVRVRALPVAQGIAVEVEDRGLGLSAAEYATANAMLHNPPDFSFTSLGEDPRLGLFTVGHLAQRHGITVTLQPSSYGGAMAVVVVPQALVAPVTDDAPESLAPRDDRRLASVPPAPTASTGVTAGGMPVRTRTAPPAAAPTSSGPRRGGSGKLPRRVRQAHLAPQLLQQQEELACDPGQGDVPERRPEQARSMLAALHEGTRRARAQEDVPSPVWQPAPHATDPPSPPHADPRAMPSRPRPRRNAP
ncbi:nitrate- and nitrite sensing domain-containing protein [Streptomyces sp. NPDC096311]|uniref:sensor histidine kinase n=1 Tax=Streptomyces sp. NPDC096311 TaxID=3366083 RepID=UPI0037F50A4B